MRDVVTSPEYLDVTVPPGKSFIHLTPRGHTVFAYVIGGGVVFCQQKDPCAYEGEGEDYSDIKRDRLITEGHLVSDGDAVSVAAEAELVRFFLVSGKPITEPIAWYGPILMNTQEELRVAFAELESDTFIKQTPWPPPRVPRGPIR